METTIKNLQEDILQEFETKIRGELVFPDNQKYEDARKVYNGMIDKKPGLIVKCVDVADVISAVTFGRENNLLVFGSRRRS